MKKKSGSALIISLLLLTFMSVSILMISHLVIRETRVATRYQDELAAKYAAESGMEWALAKIKSDPDFAIIEGDFSSITDPIPLPEITIGTTSQDSPSYTVDLTRTVQSTSQGVEVVVNKDESKEINLVNASTQYWTIEDVILNPANCANANQLYYYLEIKEYKRGNNQSYDDSPAQEKVLNNSNANDIRGMWSNLQYIPSLGGDFIRIRPIVLQRTMPRNAAQLEGSTSSVLSANCEVELHLNYHGSQYIDQGFAAIKSTGRFNESKRAVAADIDNASGRLLDIFDFVIYAGDTLCVQSGNTVCQ